MEVDIDNAHFAIHVRMVRVIELLLSPRARLFVRWSAILNCAFCCGLLIFLHLNYVGKAECLPKILANQTEDYHILQIKISSLWTKLSEELKTSPGDIAQISPLFISSKSSINLGDLLYRSLSLSTFAETYEIGSLYAATAEGGSEEATAKDETTPPSTASDSHSNTPPSSDSTPDTQTPSNIPPSPTDSQSTESPSTDSQTTLPPTDASSSVKNNVKNANNGNKKKKTVFWADLMLDELAMWQDPVYVYAREKGYLYLSSKRKEEHGVKTLNITLDSDDPCLFPGHLLLEAFVGYDTVILNNIVGTLGGKGYAYNKQTYELWSLNYIVHEPGTIRLEDYLIWKLEVAFRAILIFVISATLVSFCMKHIQIHIFQFTMQMRQQGLQRASLVPVIISHLVESSVLILVMVGVLLCVSEFMSDKTISLLVLFLMWFTELFTLLAIRTHISLKYFPRFVMCCFLLFYLYIFSFPLGFHYIAYLCLCFGIQVLIVYFYLQHEMPAILNVRAQIVQQVPQQQQQPQAAQPQNPPPPAQPTDPPLHHHSD